MKQIFTTLTIAAVIAASCNTAPKTDNAVVNSTNAAAYADTVGLAKFRAWKSQNELADFRAYQQKATAEPETKTVVKYVPVRTAAKSSASSKSRSSGSGSMNSESANAAKAPVKKGWSKAAKGAVIGGVTGGVAGAVINKRNRVAGGVIGGVIGAGAGYGIGRRMDKKDGRTVNYAGY